jgi:hypothetical protein
MDRLMGYFTNYAVASFRFADDTLVMPGNRIAGGVLTECFAAD